MDTMSSVAVNVTGPLVAGTGSDDSPSGYDISGLVISIVGSITLLQAIYTGLQRIFPEKRLKLLDDTLEETIRMYAMALEDGIFEDASKLKSIEHSLLNLRRDSDTLRAKVHVATTFKKQFHAWWNGLSKHLNSVRREVQTIRAELSLETEKERSKLERENRLPRSQLLPANAYAAYDAHRSTASNTLGMGPPISAVNPRFGTTTGIMGLHKPTNSLTTRSHTYPPVSHHLAAPPPAFVPSPSPSSGNSAPSKIDPRKRLHDLTDQLSRAARNYDPVDDGIIHTPDHVACCNATPGTSEIERTVNVLNDLTKRLSFIAASELARPVGERSASKSKPQVNAAQISLLIDALSSAQAVASQQHPTTSDADVPSTATIEEVKDVMPIENQAQAPSTPSAASNGKNH